MLTVDEYRKYRALIPLTDEAYWLATPWTTLRSPNSGTDRAYYVDTSGALNYYSVNYPIFAARPAFNLKSSIGVSSNKDSDGCYTVESTPAQSNRLYVKYNGIWREVG